MALRAFSNVLKGRLQQQLLAPASVCGAIQSPSAVAPFPSQQQQPKGAVDMQQRFASQLVVRQRMKSVGNIMKITKAMKMVAAARMRGAQTKVEGCRGIVDPSIKLFGDNPLVEGKSVTVPITSDKGLCGGVNSQVNRVTKVLQDVVGPEADKPKLAIVGDKGRSVLSRTHADSLEYTCTEATKQSITFATASAIAEDIMKTDYEASRVVFNRFKSAIAFQPTVATVLAPEAIESQPAIVEKFDEYELEGPDRSEFLTDLQEFNLAATLYWGMLENGCSEQASRVQAMENSSKNAEDMLTALTIKYNKTRQAGITTELIEIISGAVALEG
eukprot:CAMPEP_0197499000 /NCGR_PEP_ID=MMETSP1311-20131121/60802_1 /TAXON_ID=464262 /ORGANISM="Genus nov. species nov., Strain RCC856" /LENGTH=329 /DNA_ID=CAMNT_0043044739 /DNA_START=20 /DNA_END=1009 /DNA_ORIENTATION=-